MAREQDGLLGVAAKGARDRQRNAVVRSGGGHAVEGQRDVGTHRLALAVGQGAAVAAARERRQPSPRRRQLGLGPGVDRRLRAVAAHGHHSRI
jgi:hypothetical protein